MDSKTEVNPNRPSEFAVLREMGQLTANFFLSRAMLYQNLYGNGRDIHKECGHVDVLTLEMAMQLYKRGDVAGRVVSVWPQECWSEHPEVFETEEPDDTAFETAWKELNRTRCIIPQMARIDVLSGIGRFGIILLGLDDGAGMETPVAEMKPDGSLEPMGGKAKKLLYTRAFDETCVTVAELETQVTNPRFGMPLFYEVTFQDSTGAAMTGSVSVGVTGKKQRVHWTRCIHVCDNRISSDIYGQPRLELVVDRITDLSKIAGGSAEMFWKGGFPGLSLETQPDVLKNNNVVLDEEKTQDQMQSYMTGLQRYIATVGMKVNSLTVEIADPTPHVDTQLKLIATAMSIPWRVFVGSEAAQLASEQDIRTWNRRIQRRRVDYLTPYIIMPLAERLVALGVLPKPKTILVAWPDPNTPGDKDRAVIAEGMSNAMMKYVASGSQALMDPFHFLSLVLQFTDEEAASVIKKMDEKALKDASAASLKAKEPAPAKAKPAAK